ncbi:hypothetical protein ATERTT37_002295 [Aspergillus terreus]
MAGSNVTSETIRGSGYALIVLTTLIVITRFGTTLSRIKELKAEDYLLAFAYLLFLVLAILYIIIAPTLYKIKAVQLQLIQPYPELPEDSLKLQIFFFFATGSLWLCLWMVKFSLLAMYKRLLNGRVYFIAWWALLVMILPIRLIWNLRMSLSRKISIGALFGLGWICMAVSIIRVVELGNNWGNGTPEPTSRNTLLTRHLGYLAVIIGCCPGLYRVIKARVSKSEPSYSWDSYGFQMHTVSGVSANRSRVRGKDANFSRLSGRVVARGDTPASSQEELNTLGGDIMVTQRVSITVKDRDAISTA